MKDYLRNNEQIKDLKSNRKIKKFKSNIDPL